MGAKSTPWGPRPNDWPLVSWKDFASRAGTPVKLNGDSPQRQVTVRVRHQGVVERRINPQRGQVILTPNQLRVRAGQFIISKIDARNGACGFIPQDLDGAVVTQDFPVYEINGADAKYLDHLIGLPVFWHLCESVSDGTTNRVRLDLDQFDELQFPLPALPEQARIAEVLDSIDAAVEKTEAVIAASERLRAALLGELLTRGVPGWHTEWKQVPGIGTIPACWEVVRLGEVATVITKGTTPTTLGRAYTASGVRFLRVNNVSDDGHVRLEDILHIDEDTHRLLGRSQLKEHDIVFSIAGALGRTAVIRSEVLPANVNQALALVRLADPTLSEYVHLALLGPIGQTQAGWFAAALAQANLSLEQLGGFIVALPDKRERGEIVGAVRAVQLRLDSEQAELKGLKSVKSTVGAALLSGQIRVSVDGRIV